MALELPTLNWCILTIWVLHDDNGPTYSSHYGTIKSIPVLPKLNKSYQKGVSKDEETPSIRSSRWIERETSQWHAKGNAGLKLAINTSQYSFILHKSAFRDALCCWHSSGLPLQCSCGKQFTVKHALSCSHGGYIFPSTIMSSVMSLLNSWPRFTTM